MSNQTADDIKNAMAIAEAAAKEWVAKNADIKGKVRRILDNRVEEIVAKLLGFDEFGEVWELDHCNGRNGNSTAGDYLREQAGEAVKEWLDKQAKCLPKLPKGAAADLRRTYSMMFKTKLMEEIQHIAHANAVEEAERIWNEYKRETKWD